MTAPAPVPDPDGDFFVILNHPNAGPMPLVLEEQDRLATYRSASDARRAGHDNPLGEAFGFEVFELGTGGC